MSRNRTRFRCVFFGGSLMLFLGAQYGMRHFIEAEGGRIVLENRNELSSLSRLQCAREQSGDVVILGSSQTERLIPGNGVVCIGVPGSSFQAGLKFLNPALLHSGTVVVIEGDHILSGESGLMKDADKLLFKLGMRMKPLSLASRPSALIVSLGMHLKMRRLYDAQQNAPAFDLSPRYGSAEAEDGLVSQAKIDAVVGDIAAIQKTGAKVMIAIFPKQHGLSVEDRRLVRDVFRVAGRAGVRVIDYNGGLPEGVLDFQDEVHLVPTAMSTFRFRNTIARDARGERP